MPKYELFCIVCEKVFVGNAHAETCSPACRTKLSRMRKKGQKPPIELMATTKKRQSQKKKGKTPPKNEPNSGAQNHEKREPSFSEKRNIFEGIVITEADKIHVSKTERLKNLTTQRTR